MNKKLLAVIALIIFAALLRVVNIAFPVLNVEEARVAHRGYSLATTGKDELGRKIPLVFNSLNDYQLPAVSYLTMVGSWIFGKTDLGVRIPFILIGTLLVLLSFKVAQVFNPNLYFRLIIAFIVATSPALIFLSKTPNETIVLVFMFTLLFYLIMNNHRLWLIVLTMICVVLVSKLAWFILLPFLFYMVWLTGTKITSKRNLILIILGGTVVISSVMLFLTIPQSKRSLLENNFPLFSDITIKNGIDQLRGQGMQSGWPGSIDRLLFNKLHFFIVGFLHWSTHLSPAIYFGQFDESGNMSFSYTGAWMKILLIPFFVGLIATIKSKERKIKLLLPLFLILTSPAIFLYPSLSLELVTLVLPFMAIIIVIGLLQIIQVKKKMIYLFLFLITFELMINVYNYTPEYKNTNKSRPGWIQKIALDVYAASKNKQTAISDDIVPDITAFINWYTPLGDKVQNADVPWPYKYRQYNLTNIRIIGSGERFRSCGINEEVIIFVSKRDLEKIQREFDVEITDKYFDNFEENKVFVVQKGVCLT